MGLMNEEAEGRWDWRDEPTPQGASTALVNSTAFSLGCTLSSMHDFTFFHNH